MEKEKVIKFEIIEANDFGITGSLIQNTKVLKRSMDTEYSKSYNFPGWDFINKKLYTYGDEKYDNLVFTVPKEDIDLFLDKIFCINEKYGIQNRWRAKPNQGYFYIYSNGLVDETMERYINMDNQRYELGNYFQTEEEAQKVIDSKEWKEFWEKVRNGEIGEIGGNE